MVRERRGRVKNGTRRHPRGPDSEATGENPGIRAFSAGAIAALMSAGDPKASTADFFERVRNIDAASASLATAPPRWP